MTDVFSLTTSGTSKFFGAEQTILPSVSVRRRFNARFSVVFDAWEKNYGDEKDNCAQDGTHCPQDRTEGGARYSQDGAKGGARYSQDWTKGRPRYSQDGTKGGPCCPQDGAEAYITNCIADSTVGSSPPRYETSNHGYQQKQVSRSAKISQWS